jgi:predicted transcriptional regulator
LSHECRDRIYIRKDILIALTETGALNQTALTSRCGLNIMAHRDILEGMEKKGFIRKTEEAWGGKKIIKYMVTEKGIHICKQVLEPYEELFPRKNKANKVKKTFQVESKESRVENT